MFGSSMGPQDPKDVTRETARDLSGLVGELAALMADATHWLTDPEYAVLRHRLEAAHAAAEAALVEAYWTMERSGGGIDSAGNTLPQWIEEFLHDPDRKDVLSKLRHTGAQERWVFVQVVLGGAPWSVESYLTGELEYLPATEPKLPPPVTGIWVTSTYGKRGVRWDSAGWRLFRIGEHST